MPVLTVTKENFETSIQSAQQPVLLDFWAEWCGPCKRMASVLDEFATENDMVLVGKVDVEAQPELSQRFSVMGVPTFIALKNGKEVGRLVGTHSKERLHELLTF